MNEKVFIDTIKKSLNEKNQEINLNTNLKDIKKWDSLANVRVILDLNQSFKTKLDVNSTANFKTLRELYEFIK